MDKYDVIHDYYCYPRSAVLKNKLGITDASIFEQAERDITSLTIERVTYQSPPYTLQTFKKIHYALFSDVYEWAGEIRTVDISKGGTRFCTCNRIEPEATKLFRNLEKDHWLKDLLPADLATKLAEHYCEFNMLHPFREGNGRVQRIFFEHLALSSGYRLDWRDVTKDEWIQANIDGVQVEYGKMEEIFARILQTTQDIKQELLTGRTRLV
jgi:cell filamentation protein